MHRLLVIALGLVGCMKENPEYCPHHPEDPACGGMTGSDASVGSDGMEMGSDMGNSCLGAGVLTVCPMAAATGPKTLSGTFDTGGAMCNGTQLWAMPGNTLSCFVVGTDITVQNVVVTGSRPLVLVATGGITVTGHLDAASSVTSMTNGPGSLSPGTCGTFGTVANTVPAGGGAGASFASQGGPAGDGGKADNGNTNGGTAFPPFLASPPGTLRAGCRGQQGGSGQGSGGLGGFGGGAVYLAANTITIGASGIINASGAGGGAAGKTGGGGGGGSGGMILLWARTSFSITSGAIVVANGGSGSTGGDGNGSGGGLQGNDPDPTNPMSSALGPTGVAGKGGSGFAVGTVATTGGSGLSGEGGGGGGGGGGYIQANQALTPAKVSPAPNIVQ